PWGEPPPAHPCAPRPARQPPHAAPLLTIDTFRLPRKTSERSDLRARIIPRIHVLLEIDYARPYARRQCRKFDLTAEPVGIESRIVDIILGLGLDDLFVRQALPPPRTIEYDAMFGAIAAMPADAIGSSGIIADRKHICCLHIDDGKPVDGLTPIVKNGISFHDHTLAVQFDAKGSQIR